MIERFAERDGVSYYQGDGLSSAHIMPDEMVLALQESKKMFAKSSPFVLGFLLILYPLVSSAEPRHSDYKVTLIYDGPSHKYIQGSEGSAGVYWDKLRAFQAERPANFAGHFIIYSGGCGTGAVCTEVIDALTGRVVSSLPDPYVMAAEDPSQEFELVFSSDSRLVKAVGVVLGAAHAEGSLVKSYEFKDDSFSLVSID